jgi:hypothetical protein
MLYIISTPIYFSASATSSGSIKLVLAEVTKLIKFLQLQHNKSSRLKCSRDYCPMTKWIEC